MKNAFVLLAMLAVSTQLLSQAPLRMPRGESFRTDTPMAHDPVMAYEDSTYYVFSTGRGIQQMTSRDLKTWNVMHRPLMTVIPRWTRDSVPGFRDHVWAPDIVRWHGRWWMAYSCSTFGKNGSAIGLLSTRSLSHGVWNDEGCIVASRPKRDNWNAIDPCFVIDEATDTPWMAWGSFWDGIQLCRLDTTMHMAQGEKPRTIARRHDFGGVLDEDRHNDQRYAPNPTSRYAGPNAIEAPFIMRHGDFYYLFVSWDYCCRGAKSNYRVAVGRSRSVAGPYVDQKGKDMASGGGTVVIEGDKHDFEAIGHCAAYHVNGKDLYVSHGYSTRMNGAAILVLGDIKWSAEGWPVIERRTTVTSR